MKPLAAGMAFLWLWMPLGGANAEERILLPPERLEALVDAIYQIEGGAKTRHPFGVLSVPCSGYVECRRVCRNSVVKTHARWVTAGQPGDFLTYLARRYAPLNASNDPHHLNRWWLRNLRAAACSSKVSTTKNALSIFEKF